MNWNDIVKFDKRSLDKILFNNLVGAGRLLSLVMFLYMYFVPFISIECDKSAFPRVVQ